MENFCFSLEMTWNATIKSSFLQTRHDGEHL